MNILQITLMSIVEGLTEFLPVSSTAHLIITAKILGINQSVFVKSFEIAIQSGAILSIVLLYHRKLFTGLILWKKLMLSFLPTVFFGALFYKIIKNYLLDNIMVIQVALFTGGIILIAFNRYHPKLKNRISIQELNPKKLLFIGLIQCFAFIPGVSRSAAVIIAGLLAGLDMENSVELSFLLAIPTILAATGLDLVKSHNSFTSADFTSIIIGFLFSFIVAIITVSIFVKLVKKGGIWFFGIYRIILAAILFQI